MQEIGVAADVDGAVVEPGLHVHAFHGRMLLGDQHAPADQGVDVQPLPGAHPESGVLEELGEESAQSIGFGEDESLEHVTVAFRET